MAQQKHSIKEFAKLAIEKFGEDKVKYCTISFEKITDVEFIQDGWTQKMIDELKAYKQVWILYNKCPACGEQLNGPFGGFTWGIVHGYGTCGYCGEVDIKLLHYFEDGDVRKVIEAYALVGF